MEWLEHRWLLATALGCWAYVLYLRRWQVAAFIARHIHECDWCRGRGYVEMIDRDAIEVCSRCRGEGVNAERKRTT